MEYYLYNAIKTPDGTILSCEESYEYKTHKDKISKEEYMNDGIGYSVRRSLNDVPFEDVSVTTKSPFEQVRKVKFWGSYGKDGKGPKIKMALEEMEDGHIQAILKGQSQIYGTPIEEVLIKEVEYRVNLAKEDLEKKLPAKDKKTKQLKQKV